MSTSRTVSTVWPSHQVMEGAGVKLHRAFGWGHEREADPFLMLDHFKSDNPEDYEAGFPWHPHRGIETVTYMLNGTIVHQDSLGNKGAVGPGDIQWMTAGSGIVHSEMPIPSENHFEGFQLWVNLPRALKMGKPRYQEISARTVPEVALPGGGKVRIAAGSFQGVTGPVKDIAANPTFLDISLFASEEFSFSLPKEHRALIFLFEGTLSFPKDPTLYRHESTLLLGQGEDIRFEAKSSPTRLLLFSGAMLKEPIVWQGPIVMNTEKEIETAFREYQNGTFLKS